MLKIKAYTLMEVTIVMLISALTITICYSAYGIITNYYKSFQQKHKMSTEILSLKHVLDRDAEKSNHAFKTPFGCEFSLDSDKIVYTFTNHFILRQLNDLHTDTFKIKVKEMKGYFESAEIIHPDTIDQINFKVEISKDIDVAIQINKSYSATALFK